MRERLRIIVTGLVGLHPVGGVAWDYLQYVVGLHELGHDVVYHEDTWSWPFDPVRNGNVDDPAYSVHFLRSFFRTWAPELSDRWHYRHLHGESHGMPHEQFCAFARTADIHLNVSGAGILPEELADDCLRVFVDTDPGYNQVVLVERPSWSPHVDRWCAAVADHDVHLTYGESIGTPLSDVPTAGLRWQPTRMPVVLRLWEDLARRPPPPDGPWSTVMTWNGFGGPLHYAGRNLGSKGQEFERLLNLPALVDRRLEVAVGGKDAPVERLATAGWAVTHGPLRTRTPTEYRAMIAASFGELSTAKNVYVALQTGWSSTRTACYLAAGRPAVVQDTGLSQHVPTGAGLLTFNTPEEAVEQLQRVERNPQQHASAARRVAEEHFAAPRVLTDMLAAVLRGAPTAP